MMMSEINDADRRLLVCVAVAMEPEPWGMKKGEGSAGPPSPLWGGWCRRKWGGGMREQKWFLTHIEVEHPAASRFLLPPETRVPCPVPQKRWLADAQWVTTWDPFLEGLHLLLLPLLPPLHSLHHRRTRVGTLLPPPQQPPFSLPPPLLPAGCSLPRS